MESSEIDFMFYLEAILAAICTAICFIFLWILISVARLTTKKDNLMPKTDDFSIKYGYTYDYVFVFKVYLEDEINTLNPFQLKYTMKNLIDRCQLAQIEAKCFYSCQRDEIYLKVRADPKRLLAEANRIDYKMLLDSTNLKLAAKAGYAKKNEFVWKPINITDEFGVSPYDPYEFIYARYISDDRMQYLYKQYLANVIGTKKIYQPFRTVDRIKLLISIFEAHIQNNPPGCGLELNNFISNQIVLSHFPLHDYAELRSLEKRWIKLFSSLKDQPIDEIKDYFGERIGLYFAFLNYYASMLNLPAIIGIIAFLVRSVERSSESLILPFYAGFMALWSTWLVEGWKRNQSTRSMKWGSTGYEDEEIERVEFNGVMTKSPIDGKPILYQPYEDIYRTRIFIYIVISSFMGVVVAVIVLISMLQDYLYILDSMVIGNRNSSTYIVALILVIIIHVLNGVYKHVAFLLNDFENHRTDTNYEDSLVGKIFVFQFFNSYSYLTYVAFVKPFQHKQCVQNDCIQELSDLLLVLMMVPIFFHSFEEVILRKIQQLRKYNRETSNLEPGIFPGIIEEQYILSEYKVMEGTLNDYSAVLIEYGYTSMFISAFPLSPAISLLSTNMRMLIDGWKLCQVFRRPQPKTAEDIGVWQDAMDILSVISVVYTFALIFFTSHYLIDTTWNFRWIYYILTEHFVVGIKYYVGLHISDVPEEVEMQLERQRFLVSKIIDNEADDADDNFKITSEAKQIKISVTDQDWVYPSQLDQLQSLEEETSTPISSKEAANTKSSRVHGIQYFELDMNIEE